MCAQIAVAPFVVENTTAIDARSQGRRVTALADPPQRSTTIEPW
jgi:hypothetical protein